MKIKNIVTYIERQIEKGVNDENIVEALTDDGWTTDSIQVAFNEIADKKFEKKIEQLQRQVIGMTHLSHTAESIMNKDVIKKDDAKISKFIEVMNKKESDYVIILKNKRPTGIVHRSEILEQIKDGRINMKKNASSIMANLISCNIDDKLIDVWEKLKLANAFIIVVLKKNSMVGVITPKEILNYLTFD